MRKVRLLTPISLPEGLAQAGEVIALPARQAFDYVRRELAVLEAGEEPEDSEVEAAALNLEQNEKAIIPKARRRG